jgi:hypothetical protein
MEGRRERGNDKRGATELPFSTGGTMKLWTRLAVCYALSLGLCAMAQQAMLLGMGENIVLEMIPHLAGCLVLITLLFAVVAGFGRRGVDWTAAVLLAAMLAFGTLFYHAGINSRTPGIGGHIFYGVAMLVVFYFLIPSALAVLLHWGMLRRALPRQA